MNEDTTVYKVGFNHYFFMAILSILALTYGFISNFSLESKIDSLLKSNLEKMRRCPISYESLGLSYLIPGASLKDVTISPRCFQGEDEVVFKSLTTNLGFPSFSPIGPTLNTDITDKFSKISIISAHGISEHKLRIESRKLSSKTINSFIKDFSLNGDFDLTAVGDFNLKSVKSMLINLKSNNLVIPTQNVKSLLIPKLDIKNFSLIANLNARNELNIKKFVIGDERSPVRANIEGKIKVNSRSIQSSELDLNIVVKFSEQFVQNFGIISLFLDSTKQDENGFYTINLTGTVARPKHAVIKK